MEIQNNEQFAKLLYSLVEDPVNTPKKDREYFWFLGTVLKSLEEKSLLEILEDLTGIFRRYIIVRACVDDNDRYLLELELQDKGSNELATLSYRIINVEQNTLQMKAPKFYLETDKGQYRFQFFLQDN
jgi:hypothetical protein